MYNAMSKWSLIKLESNLLFLFELNFFNILIRYSKSYAPASLIPVFYLIFLFYSYKKDFNFPTEFQKIFIFKFTVQIYKNKQEISVRSICWCLPDWSFIFFTNKRNRAFFFKCLFNKIKLCPKIMLLNINSKKFKSEHLLFYCVK
jgi:hypothetical protein